MRWQSGRSSDNVEDQRSAGGGGGGPLMIGGGMGIGGVVLVLIMLFLGVDPRVVMQGGPGGGGGMPMPGDQRQEAPNDPEQEKLADFTSKILASTEDVWTERFAEAGQTYKKPHLVLYTGQVESACGSATAAVGPFYCPNDEKVYVDLSFYRELREKFHAPGDAAQAYVIAHEIGHHVQKLMGITDKMEQAQARASKIQHNHLSVRLELQADYLAGVWAHYAAQKDLFEEGDIEEALRAANSIGDDKLQKQAQGYVVPDAFTHGTSEQRLRAFREGFSSGDLRHLNRFFEDDQL